MNGITKKENWRYLVFFLIGIISLPIGLISGRLLLNNIEGIWQFIFPLFICLVLFAIAMYAFKVRSTVFALKALAISFGFLFLIFAAWFMWSESENESGAISIRRFDTPQGKYAELTADELKGYPALEKALSGEGCIKSDENSWYCKVDTDEWRRTSDFIRTIQPMNGDRLFKINEKYYRIGFMIT